MKKVIVVYGGGFQPFHQGHMSSYEEAKRAFPSADFYVASSNDTKVRPIPFSDKKFLAQQAGVRDDFVQVRQPVNPDEILRKYDPEKDILILVRSERDPVKYTKKDGSPAYYQPFKNLKDCKPFDPKTGHGYIFVTKKKDFSVAGQEVFSGSQVRKMYSDADDAKREEIVDDLYPKASNPAKVKKLLDKYIGGLKEELEMDEALSLQGRRKRAMQVRRLRAKMLRARERAMKRFASQPTLTKRARRQAVTFLKRRIGGGKAYQTLSPSQKISIDKKIEAMKGVIGKIGSRLLPQVKRREVQRRQNMAQTESLNFKFTNLFEKPQLPQDTHVGGKEGTQPSKYYKGLDKETKERRDAHFKRMGPKSDSDKSAYADAPGDKEAREKGMPQSKHTLKFKQMFGEEIGKKEFSRLDQLVRLGLADKTLLSTIKKAMQKIESGDALSNNERQATQNLLSTLLDMVTSQDQLFNLAKSSLRKEQYEELREATYVGNIGIIELAKFYKVASKEHIEMFQKLLVTKDYKRAWALVQGATGMKLLGKEFNESAVQILEKGEYDDYEEFDGLEMAQIEVANLIQDAEYLLDILSEMDEEPEAWVLSKITKAVDYIESVTDYLEFEDDYDYNDDEEDFDSDYENESEFEFSDTDVYEALSDMSKEEMGEELHEIYHVLHEEIEGLKKKAEKSGIAYSILKKVYDRGMAAWQGGHRPGTTPQQWAFARVNSFITKGKGTWGGADSDLAAKAKGSSKNEAFAQFAETLEWGTDELRKKYASDTPGQTPEIQVASHSTLNNLFKQNVEKIKRAHDVHEAIDWHLDNKVPLTENVYRVGSEMYFKLYREARKLYNEGKLELEGLDRSLIEETEIGKFAFTEEGQPVPLDCPMIMEEEDEDKDPPLNKPKRGGSKKFYVYVRKPDGGIKKVTWGDTTGLSVKLDDPEARKSFAARHQCDMQKDKTTAAYWACNTPRYAKQLGLSGGGNFFW